MADVEKVSDRPLLELTDVNVRFGGIHAIRDISE